MDITRDDNVSNQKADWCLGKNSLYSRIEDADHDDNQEVDDHILSPSW